MLVVVLNQAVKQGFFPMGQASLEKLCDDEDKLV